MNLDARSDERDRHIDRLSVLGQRAKCLAQRVQVAKVRDRHVRSAQSEREVVLSDDGRKADGHVNRECSIVLDVDFQADPMRALSA